MEKNRNYVFLLVAGIAGMVVGILCCITIFGAIVGIPLILGATKYLAWSKMSNDDLYPLKNTLLTWGIVFSILMFPLGLIALVPAFNLDGKIYTNETSQPKNEFKPTEAKTQKKSKAERILDLHNLKEKGLIDDNDFQIAKNKIINESEE